LQTEPVQPRNPVETWIPALPTIDTTETDQADIMGGHNMHNDKTGLVVVACIQYLIMKVFSRYIMIRL
jgi:hypothetical protein